jgi:hypothetical protein
MGLHSLVFDSRKNYALTNGALHVSTANLDLLRPLTSSVKMHRCLLLSIGLCSERLHETLKLYASSLTTFVLELADRHVRQWGHKKKKMLDLDKPAFGVFQQLASLTEVYERDTKTLHHFAVCVGNEPRHDIDGVASCQRNHDTLSNWGRSLS